MASLPAEFVPSRDSLLPAGRAFVRSLNVLLKYTRLYGLEHTRAAGQFESAWGELREALQFSGSSGLLLGASESQLLLDGVPLESTPAERSFAKLLTTTGVASICFGTSTERGEFASLVRAFTEIGAHAEPLSERLQRDFAPGRSGIRVNEIRFVAEDASSAEVRLAAQITAKTLGADAAQFQDWFRSPEKMIQLIAAAEGAHGGASARGTESSGFYAGGEQSGTQAGAACAGEGGSPALFTDRTGAVASAFSALGASDAGAASSSFLGAAGMGNLTGLSTPLAETELRTLLRLLTQLGEAIQPGGTGSGLDASMWQAKMASLAPNAQITLRQALAAVAMKSPGAKMDDAMLLRLAENLAIRFALERYQRGEVRVNAVRQMLDGMAHELDSLRKLLRVREEKLASAGVSIESHSDVLDRQFWATVPESGKRSVLTSPEAWCIPPRNIHQYVEELLGRGDSEAAGDILTKYASCIRNKDAEARRKAALGLSQLADLYSKAASQRLQDTLGEIGAQMVAEREPELQTLLSAAFVRLSQEAASRRYYKAMQQSLDALADLEEQRPNWAKSLCPRIGVENRVGEFIEEAIVAESLPDGLTGVLVRIPDAAAEALAQRLARAGRRSEREKIIELAQSLGAACARRLNDIFRAETGAHAANVVGLLSRLDPAAVEDAFSARLRGCSRGFQDAVVRQLAAGGAPERGRILAASLGLLDPAVAPLALDEIGMCGDPAATPGLLHFAETSGAAPGGGYLRVKAIEAIGRIRAPSAIPHLRNYVEARKTFGWLYPEEVRLAAAQALLKIDAEWISAFLPQSGLDAKSVGLAPLDPEPERDIVRHRRYRRVRLPRNIPAVITSARGKYSSAISVLSLEGGLLSGDLQLAVGTEATLKIPAGLRAISMRTVVRFVRSHQAGFELTGMALEDRAKLRRLLISFGS